MQEEVVIRSNTEKWDTCRPFTASCALGHHLRLVAGHADHDGRHPRWLLVLENVDLDIASSGKVGDWFERFV